MSWGGNLKELKVSWICQNAQSIFPISVLNIGDFSLIEYIYIFHFEVKKCSQTELEHLKRNSFVPVKRVVQEASVSISSIFPTVGKTIFTETAK